MKQILRENAFESWAMAIQLADEIYDGEATFINRKYFVDALQNAIELFIKQYMLNQNDYRVAKLKRECDADGEPLREYLASDDLNNYFNSIVTDKDKMKRFYTAEFNEIMRWQKDLFSSYYDMTPNSHITSELKLLQELRNSVTHFYADKADFLSDLEFEQLYNMMIRFYEILKEYKLLPYFGKASGKYEHISFERIPLKAFSYENNLMKSKFVIKLKEIIEGRCFDIFYFDEPYSVAENIVRHCEELDDKFDDVWSYVQMLIKYNRLHMTEYVDTEFIDGFEVVSSAYCEYTIM